MRVFICPTKESSFNIEQKFKKYAKSIGILVKKYDQTEIINTDNPQEYIGWFENEVKKSTRW